MILFENIDCAVEGFLRQQNALLTRADDAVVEDSAADDLRNGFFQLHAAIHNDLHVAGSDAQSRLAARICRLDHARAAGCNHNVHALHQGIGGIDGGFLNGLNQINRRAEFCKFRTEQIHHILVDVLRSRVGRYDNGVLSLEREHRVAHRGHNRVGHGGHRADHAFCFGNADDADLLVLADDADRLLALEAVPNALGLAVALGNLIGINAHAALFASHSCQFLGAVIDHLANGADDLIGLFL